MLASRMNDETTHKGQEHAARTAGAARSLRGENKMFFADALQKCRQDRKTGLLTVTVIQSNKFVVRVYFQEGNICRLSYGPLLGRECLEYLEFYDLGEATYLDGMKAPRSAGALPPTDDVISSVRGTGKTIHLKQWLERR